MKLTNEEIAKVFAMYQNAEVINPMVPYISLKYNNVMARWYDASYYERSESNSEFWDNRKLHLTPLSKISDEDAIEVAKTALGMSIKEGKEENAIWYGKRFVKGLFNGSSAPMGWCIYQYLISQSYAVPLFFSPGHLANGKDAIALGVAIDKTEIK